ncbi:hypothetical protein BYT27DRAFT_7334393 [Phlegmacium glaucopus]|nr:hypothetical protein BYT27DRAFT_7334393 [Phlegmacium glaucopus]
MNPSFVCLKEETFSVASSPSVSFIMFAASKSFSVTFATAKETVYYASRSISHYTWKGKAPYKAGSAEQQKSIDAAFNGAKDLGFDAQGAHIGEIAGGFHNHTPGGAGPRWITVKYTDAEGKVLYHQKADGKVWDRIHIWDDATKNKDPAEKPVKIWAQ